MFDTIGRDLDDEANKRRAQSLLLSLLGMGAVMGFAVGITAYTAVELVTELDADTDMVPVVLAEPDAAPDLPTLPPPPPPPAAAKAEVEPDDQVEPEPDPDTTPTELQEPPDDIVRSEARPDGEDGGVDGGDLDGELGGIPGGEKGGTGDRLGTSGGPKVFHHQELQTRSRVQPVYPKAARSMNLGEQRCKARVQIDATGRPYDVVVEDCPAVFHAPTKEALLKWRWYAPRDGRRKVAAQTVIAITYALR
jgi:hypothetical protein